MSVPIAPTRKQMADLEKRLGIAHRTTRNAHAELDAFDTGVPPRLLAMVANAELAMECAVGMFAAYDTIDAADAHLAVLA